MRKFEVRNVRILGYGVRPIRFSSGSVSIECENFLTSTIEVGLFCREWWLVFWGPGQTDNLLYGIFRPKLQPRWLYVSFAGLQVEQIIAQIRQAGDDSTAIMLALTPLLEYAQQHFKPADKKD